MFNEHNVVNISWNFGVDGTFLGCDWGIQSVQD